MVENYPLIDSLIDIKLSYMGYLPYFYLKKKM